MQRFQFISFFIFILFSLNQKNVFAVDHDYSYLPETRKSLDSSPDPSSQDVSTRPRGFGSKITLDLASSSDKSFKNIDCQFHLIADITDAGTRKSLTTESGDNSPSSYPGSKSTYLPIPVFSQRRFNQLRQEESKKHIKYVSLKNLKVGDVLDPFYSGQIPFSSELAVENFKHIEKEYNFNLPSGVNYALQDLLQGEEVTPFVSAVEAAYDAHLISFREDFSHYFDHVASGSSADVYKTKREKKYTTFNAIKFFLLPEEAQLMSFGDYSLQKAQLLGSLQLFLINYQIASRFFPHVSLGGRQLYKVPRIDLNKNMFQKGIVRMPFINGPTMYELGNAVHHLTLLSKNIPVPEANVRNSIALLKEAKLGLVEAKALVTANEQTYRLMRSIAGRFYSANRSILPQLLIFNDFIDRKHSDQIYSSEPGIDFQHGKNQIYEIESKQITPIDF